MRCSQGPLNLTFSHFHQSNVHANVSFSYLKRHSLNLSLWKSLGFRENLLNVSQFRGGLLTGIQ